MQSFICVTCGVGHAPSEAPPERCAICDDERQYVTAAGQRWTTLAELKAKHTIEFKEQEPGLVGIGATPSIAIGQRMLLIQQPGGGVLWDCTPLVTDEAVARIKELGGVRAMAISHPHFYSSMVDWSEALGGVPIHIHETNQQYVMRPSERVNYWSGETLELVQGVTLRRSGGHFVGSTVLHWAGEDGKGVLMTGDTIMVVPDTRWVSFMYSYPNLIPLPAREVNRIVGTVEPFAYDRIYAAWWDRVMAQDAKARVAASAERYVKAIS
ncbi:MBL fold metallo-hydrolase [Devosia insulae DS-56]|uniref:MBL fold metallo-hydrolase n=1 Tax=Devosia insulae DS-56 TaxID=1116389 RepID=A0A1E5XTH6_9HYPH|nr:MBL fold metallo-hydrolase [Devosia insulae]OEO31881.1 MBL fold metallo-hydrolase [Devosia insulae DS-56]